MPVLRHTTQLVSCALIPIKDLGQIECLILIALLCLGANGRAQSRHGSLEPKALSLLSAGNCGADECRACRNVSGGQQNHCQVGQY